MRNGGTGAASPYIVLARCGTSTGAITGQWRVRKTRACYLCTPEIRMATSMACS